MWLPNLPNFLAPTRRNITTFVDHFEFTLKVNQLVTNPDAELGKFSLQEDSKCNKGTFLITESVLACS